MQDAKSFEFPDAEVGHIFEAIGPAAKVAYAATHVYPMGAPNFQKTPFAERPQPKSEALRLYVHVPFCNYLCTFCFYAKAMARDRAQMEEYVDAMERELEWIEPGTLLSQLFVGGGTPTALPPDLFDRMLGAIFDRTTRVDGVIHTCESSPESITLEHIQVLKDRGIGRMSMGIQTLDEDILNGIDRRHGAKEAVDAIRLIIDSGLILNIDLIYGLPGQSEESFYRDLRTVTDAGVHAVTLYNLRLNENTPVARVLTDQERLDLGNLMRWRGFVRAAAHEMGFTQTRWHTYKRLDTIAARHERLPTFNAEGGYQLGVGMSARSYLGSAVYRNHKNLKVYMDRMKSGESPVEETFPLDEEGRKTQFVARSLGDGKPLNLTKYARTFGSSVDDDFGALVESLLGADLIESHGDELLLSDRGKLVHDVITLAFYPVHARAWAEKRQHMADKDRGVRRPPTRA